MKILFVSALLPYPLHSGGQVRVYNLLKRLGTDHDVTLFTFIRQQSERTLIPHLSFCRRVAVVYRGHAWQPSYVAKSLLGRYPLLFATYDNQQMRRLVEKELSGGDYDLVHIEPGYVWPSLPKLTIPLVVSEHNIEYEVYKGYVAGFPVVPLRPLLGYDVMKLAFWERRVWKGAKRIVAVSKEDKETIARVVPKDMVSVVPNGVDITEYKFKPKSKGNETFLFVGNFSWMQNRDAIRLLLDDVWPMILTRYPKATLRIVGRRAPKDLRRLIKQTGAMLLEGVEDITTEYAHADVLLAPIRIGGGSRYKILEAMASGLPVVTTRLGASGLDVTNGEELLIGDSPEDMAGAVDRLVSDESLRKAITQAARKRIEVSYSWEVIAKRQQDVWKEAVV